MASKLTFLCVLFFVFSLSKGNETIKRLQGSQKGSKVQGLHNLKLYLARFGYLNYQHTPNHVNSNENDEFDEELEAALKDYQNFHHLNPTGMLDEPTVSQMLMPRCGVPDKKISNNHESKLLHIVSHYTFFPNSPRWGKNRLTYAFNSNYPSIYISPVERKLGKRRPWRWVSIYWGVLAHAFSPSDGRFHYNADQSWSIGARQNSFDVETVALHEIGHLLGLGHSQFQNAIMWSAISSGAVKGLASDDIQGIKALYGYKK
ncbi:putative matrilysin [Helianthus annuus]|nr:putative matrilysin [Helianthus annuus]